MLICEIFSSRSSFRLENSRWNVSCRLYFACMLKLKSLKIPGIILSPCLPPQMHTNCPTCKLNVVLLLSRIISNFQKFSTPIDSIYTSSDWSAAIFLLKQFLNGKSLLYNLFATLPRVNGQGYLWSMYRWANRSSWQRCRLPWQRWPSFFLFCFLTQHLKHCSLIWIWQRFTCVEWHLGILTDCSLISCRLLLSMRNPGKPNEL